MLKLVQMIYLVLVLKCTLIYCKMSYSSNTIDQNADFYHIRYYSYMIPIHMHEGRVLSPRQVMVRHPMYRVSANSGNHKKKRKSNKVDPEPVPCSKSNFTAELRELNKKLKCVPRETIVDLVPPQGIQINPKKVIVNRCGGLCNGGKSCLSIGTRNKTLVVRTVSANPYELPKCTLIMVPEDTKCLCNCATPRSRCSPQQQLDTTQCKCSCTNKKAKADCRQNKKFLWDEDTCSCGCTRTEICTTGTIWQKQQCRCIKKEF